MLSFLTLSSISPSDKVTTLPTSLHVYCCHLQALAAPPSPHCPFFTSSQHTGSKPYSGYVTPHLTPLFHVVSEGSQSKSTPLTGPEGPVCSGPAHTSSSLTALSSPKKLSSPLPQGLCSSLCLKCSSLVPVQLPGFSLTGTFLTIFSQTGASSPTALPEIPHPLLYSVTSVYRHLLQDTISPVKMF